MPGAGSTHGPLATKKAGGSYHRYAERSGIPCAMAYGLWRALPGVPGFDGPRHVAKRLAKLDLSVARPGPHAFARPLVASLVSRRHPRPPQPASRFVTIGRKLPLDEAGWR
jgi:hypothetical protein